MQSSIFSFVLIGLLSSLTACASSGNPSVKNEALTSQIQMGITTKEEVKTLLGTPTTTHLSAMNGHTQEIWSYSHATVQTHPLLFVPVVGLFALAADDMVTADSQNLTVFFSDDGIVQSITKGTFQSGTGGNAGSTSQTEMPITTPGGISPEALQRIQVQASTKEDVQGILGHPSTKTAKQTAEGTQELWTYIQTTIHPGVGNSQGASHTIMFNEEGVVIGVTTTTF